MSAELITRTPPTRRDGASRPPATVVAASRLMYAGAALELAALITIVVTAGSVRSAVLAAHPAQWHAVLIHITGDEIGAPIAIGLWLWLAWASGRGYDWARLVFTAFFGLMTLSLLNALAGHGLVYARADVTAGLALWLVALAAIVLIFSKKSNRYYRQGIAQR
ncbi:MAG TPA: hypothetical protein VLW44_23315 [Streptosporangiaceae bacterium]|nr:hypothetical protein [Streptosporangiaceae bacterium]